MSTITRWATGSAIDEGTRDTGKAEEASRERRAPRIRDAAQYVLRAWTRIQTNYETRRLCRLAFS